MKQPAWAIGVALAIAAVYAPVAGFDFVNWDDDQYIVENPHVLGGLTSANIARAFTTTLLANWHPLTWLSHQLDCTLFGPRPGPAHLENVAWHLLNTLLVWRLWNRLTGHLLLSAFVAALFALHPLHVESVAWVSERKDLLSTCFGLLAMLAYLRYVEQPSTVRMLAVAGLQALSLAAKPMLVTLPVLVLILDYWPLERKSVGLTQRLWEKWPLIAVSALFSLIAVFTQQHGGALQSFEQLPLDLRLASAAQAYLAYLGQTVWPVNLACFYPLPTAIGADTGARLLFLAHGIAAAAVLLVVTVCCWRWSERVPYLFAGWLWYLVALLPVIGIVQVGWQARADRYTYLPLVGLFVAVVWQIQRWACDCPWRQRVGALLGVAICLSLAVLSAVQVQVWRNSETLFAHCLAVTGEQPLAHFNLGLHLAQQGRDAEAEEHYRRAIQLQPVYPRAHNNLGALLVKRGDFAAFEQFRIALEQQPDSFETLMNLGQAYETIGKPTQSVEHLSRAVELRQDDSRAQMALGRALSNAGNFDAAEWRLRKTLRLSPGNAEATLYLGMVVVRRGRTDEGRALLEEARRLAVDDERIRELAARELERISQ